MYDTEQAFNPVPITVVDHVDVDSVEVAEGRAGGRGEGQGRRHVQVHQAILRTDYPLVGINYQAGITIYWHRIYLEVKQKIL
jgi:hypothetical protein